MGRQCHHGADCLVRCRLLGMPALARLLLLRYAMIVRHQHCNMHVKPGAGGLGVTYHIEIMLILNTAVLWHGKCF